MEWVTVVETKDLKKATKLWALLVDAGIYARMNDIASVGAPHYHVTVPEEARAEAQTALDGAAAKDLALLRRQLSYGRIRWDEALLAEFKNHVNTIAPTNGAPFFFHGEVFVYGFAVLLIESVERLLPIFRSLEPKEGP